MISLVLVSHDQSGKKIKVDGPVVELDGDEMTRVIWKMIKDKVRTIYVNMQS